MVEDPGRPPEPGPDAILEEKPKLERGHSKEKVPPIKEEKVMAYVKEDKAAPLPTKMNHSWEIKQESFQSLEYQTLGRKKYSSFYKIV